MPNALNSAKAASFPFQVGPQLAIGNGKGLVSHSSLYNRAEFDLAFCAAEDSTPPQLPQSRNLVIYDKFTRKKIPIIGTLK